MASTARIDELKKKFDENPRRYFAPLANEFRKSGDIEQAILICEEFLPQQPGHMSGHIVYGQALYEAGRLPEARGVFETALGLDPENLIALRHLGDIARGQADAVAARTWYARVLDADPRNEEIQALIGDIDRDSPQAIAAESAPPVTLDLADTSSGIELEMDPTVLDAPSAERAATESMPADAPSVVTSPFGSPVVPPPLPSKAADPELLDGFSLHGFDMPAERDAQPGAHVAAEGLESTTFEPPTEQIATTDELDDSLDSGVPSFAAPSTNVESLAGLQGSGGMDHLDDAAPAAVELDEFAPLDLDDNSTLPPQGDPLAGDRAPDAFVALNDERVAPPSDFLDFEMPVLDTGVTASDTDAPMATGAGSTAPLAASHEQAHENDIPVELPPAVIAAEAGLMDEREPSPGMGDGIGAVDEAHTDEPVSAHAPFVTETMAELYLAQGHRDEARAVYEQLLAAHPDDARLTALVASLAPSMVVADAAPFARDFFARLAARRPAERASNTTLPADDDFASPPASELPPAEQVVPVPPPVDAPYSVEEAESFHEVVPPAIERAAAMRTPDGSISALFGNRTPGTSEDSAAAALAQAFGGEAAAPLGIAGKPAHAASGELSLDSVFRDGPARPPRTSQSFSFDQFFTGGGERERTPPRISSEIAMPAEAPAERSVEDVEQFNSWLQGLKPQ